MAKYYTGRGDKGKTSTLAGADIPKDSRRIGASGAVDELQAALGVCRALLSAKTREFDDILKMVQEDLFAVGTDITSAGTRVKRFGPVKKGRINWLESEIDRIAGKLEPLDAFIFPHGNHLVSWLHLCRAVCRRAERAAVAFRNSAETSTFNEYALAYLNRLSSLLFVLARYAAKKEGVKEEKWKKKTNV